MPITVRGDVAANTLSASAEFLEKNNGLITFNGKGAVISVGPNNEAKNINITMGDDCTFTSGENTRLGALTVYTRRASNIRIGSSCGFTWDTSISAHESYDVNIGDGCLFAGKTWISVSDMHSIIDIETKKRINPGADVNIGNKVWVCLGASILKGATIGEGSIIATGSIVSKDVEKNCLVAGSPAKLVRSGVTWVGELLDTA